MRCTIAGTVSPERLGAYYYVVRDDEVVLLAPGDGDGRDFLIEMSCGFRCCGLRLGPSGEPVLVLPADAVKGHEVFRRCAHAFWSVEGV